MSGRHLTWERYALDGHGGNLDYWHSEHFKRSFAPGGFVVDVGCGHGWMLGELRRRGYRGIGTEVADELVEATRAGGNDAVLAPAEALPLESASADGVVLAGVLPFTDEEKAFSEIARVLRPGGRLEAYYLGPGFGLRDLLLGRNWRERYMGARALTNTLLMLLVGRKLPGRLGKAVYATHGRLAAFYKRHGLVLNTHTPSPTFLGLPVFIYHSVDRAGGGQASAR